MVLPIILTDEQLNKIPQTVKNLPAMQKIQAQSLGQKDPLEKGIATHSSILARRIPRTDGPGRLQSMRTVSSVVSNSLQPYGL